MTTTSDLTPLLVVRGAAQAIDFYVQALGAEVLARYEHGPQQHVSHADLAVGPALFAVTEEVRAFNSDSPPSLGGSPVVLQLAVSDADAVLTSMCDAGATVVFSAQELLGERMARVRDPFGHLWILRQRLQSLSTDEIQRQRDALFARFATSQTTTDMPARLEDKGSLEDRSALGQRENGLDDKDWQRGAETSRARVHLITGPVGAGKSTFATRLARERHALRLTLDAWMATLFRADRPPTGVIEWYGERTERCIEQIWSTTKDVIELGRDVVLEIGLLRRSERESFYRRLEAAGISYGVSVLDASRDVRRRRVSERNVAQGPTYSMFVPASVFELASDQWQPPDATECGGRDVRFIWTDED